MFVYEFAIEAKSTMSTINSNDGIKITYWSVKEKRNADEVYGSIVREAKRLEIAGDQHVKAERIMPARNKMGGKRRKVTS